MISPFSPSQTQSEQYRFPKMHACSNSKSSNFTPLKDLEPGKLVNAVGVVGAFREITRAAHGRRGPPMPQELCLTSRLHFLNNIMRSIPRPNRNRTIMFLLRCQCRRITSTDEYGRDPHRVRTTY